MSSNRNTRFLLNEVDRSGRPIAPELLSAAREIGPRAIAYAENLIGDPAVAVTCLEEAAASVSAVIAEKLATGAPAVRNVSAYLFRTFINRIDKAKQKQTSLEQSLQKYGGTEFAPWEESREETRVLLNEIMAICGQVSGKIVMLHLEGWSWDEIAERFGISRHAAETRYRKALDRARKTLKIEK
jgi:DNA-directed RNA polymerase specialized sigma24 family protein